MTTIAIAFGVWLAINIGFIAGVWWTCRPRAPEPPPRPVRVVQRVARYARTVPVRGEWCFVPGDVVPWREDYAPADRVVLDQITGVVENWGHKW